MAGPGEQRRHATQAGDHRTHSYTEQAFRAVLTGPGPLLLLALGAAMVWRIQENGWGSLVWLITCAAVKCIRIPFENLSKQDTFSKSHQQATDKLVMFGFGLGGALIPMTHLLTGILSFANYPLPIWVPAISIVGLVPGLVLFRASHVDLGRNWSATTELRDGHALVTTGIYTHVRHPMYSGLWLIFAMFPLLVHNWIAGWSPLAGFALMYFVRAPYEEQMMQEEFGQAYSEYMNRSGRLWPRFSKMVGQD